MTSLGVMIITATVQGVSALSRRLIGGGRMLRGLEMRVVS